MLYECSYVVDSGRWIRHGLPHHLLLIITKYYHYHHWHRILLVPLKLPYSTLRTLLGHLAAGAGAALN